MNNWYDYTMLVPILSNVSAIIICYYFLSNVLLAKKQSKKVKYLILITITCIFMGTLVFLKQSPFFVLVSVGTFLSIGLLLFQGNVLKRLLYSIFFVAFGGLAETITGIIVALIFSFSLNELYLYPIYYTLVAVGSKVILLIFVRFAIRIIQKQIQFPSLLESIALFSIPFVSLMVCLNLYFMVIKVENSELIGVISVSALLYINIMIFAILKVLDRESNKSLEYKNANIQLELEQKHYKEILEKNYEVRGLWHDMNNHVITMQYLIKNHACDEINEYLLQLHDVLQNAVDHNLSGNNVVDALLNYKIRFASDKNINIDHYIAIPEKLKMNSIDLSIILGNILDNAIEGCLRDSRSDNDKIIKFNMYYKKESLLIDVENTVDEKTIKKSGNKLISSKISKHNKSGYGIANVKQVLDHYGGNMITQILDDRFKCTILIPLD